MPGLFRLGDSLFVLGFGEVTFQVFALQVGFLRQVQTFAQPFGEVIRLFRGRLDEQPGQSPGLGGEFIDDGLALGQAQAHIRQRGGLPGQGVELFESGFDGFRWAVRLQGQPPVPCLQARLMAFQIGGGFGDALTDFFVFRRQGMGRFDTLLMFGLGCGGGFFPVGCAIRRVWSARGAGRVAAHQVAAWLR